MYFSLSCPKLIEIFLHHSPQSSTLYGSDRNLTHRCLFQPPHPQGPPPPLALADTLTQQHLSLSIPTPLGHYSLLNQRFPRRQWMVCVRHCHFLLPRSWTKFYQGLEPITSSASLKRQHMPVPFASFLLSSLLASACPLNTPGLCCSVNLLFSLGLLPWYACHSSDPGYLFQSSSLDLLTLAVSTTF